MKYKVSSKTETGDIELYLESNDLGYAEWLAKAMLKDFGNVKIFEQIGEHANAPVYRLKRSYSFPTDKQQALNL